MTAYVMRISDWSSDVCSSDLFFPGPVSAVTSEGALYGIPIRQNVAGLHFNEEFFQEKGLEGPPATIEEFLDLARRLTYTREDGTQVTRSEEHTSELQSLMRITYAVFCLKKQHNMTITSHNNISYRSNIIN